PVGQPDELVELHRTRFPLHRDSAAPVHDNASLDGRERRLADQDRGPQLAVLTFHPSDGDHGSSDDGRLRFPTLPDAAVTHLPRHRRRPDTTTETVLASPPRLAPVRMTRSIPSGLTSAPNADVSRRRASRREPLM